ncbi:hypothetical protein PPTS312_44040 [Pseudomonas putida]|uniref:DUF6161 domain-containing protein n=1 Tax=Pseudomonas putida TaxID=303 RepID=A0A7U6RE62_PSEPU|nr:MULTISPECIES: DUF6161 domain-containing protein [Pseudomonas putida group]MDD2125679.1 DUF6161 domain-containing protein [Pseudomonas monteilii]BBU46489.1 hypothetical protein PPTS312_44040 [Pseudomonas putida]
MTNIENNISPENTSSASYPYIARSKSEQLRDLSDEQMLSWVNLEIKYWAEIHKRLEQQKNQQPSFRVHPAITEAFSNYLTTLNKYIENSQYNTVIFDDDEIQDPSSKLLKNIFSFDLPQHDDPQAEDFKRACITGDAASALYSYRMSINNLHSLYFKGYQDGISRNLKTIANGVDSKFSDTISDLNQRKLDLHDDIKAAEDTITKIVAAATSAIALSEPVKFWDDRKEIHKTNAQKYAKYATYSAISFALMLGLIIIYEYMSGTTHSWLGYEFTVPKSLSGIAIILLISTGGIWATRIFVKLMMANLTMETESIERATMIKTFVAMKAAEASIAQEAELLFYTTLFRPSNNVISEESTAPEFGKILDAILKVKPDKPGTPA